MSDAELKEMADAARVLIEERRANAVPTRCSHCLGGSDRQMYVQEKGEPHVMLCSLRCMSLWAMQRGWPR